MAMAVVTVASGGLAVVDNTALPAGPTRIGMPVSESVAGGNGIVYGVRVTKVTAPAPGLPVIYVTPPP